MRENIPPAVSDTAAALSENSINSRCGVMGKDRAAGLRCFIFGAETLMASRS